MKVIYEGSNICEVPDHMSSGDTLIFNNKVYQISTKTFDVDNSELYCIVFEYEEKKEITVHDIMTAIYDSERFQTSGFNTNDIMSNPRLTVLMVIAAVVIDHKHMMAHGASYKGNVIGNWNSGSIPWCEIFTDNPPVANDKMAVIRKLCKPLLSKAKIAKSIWPESLR